MSFRYHFFTSLFRFSCCRSLYISLGLLRYERVTTYRKIIWFGIDMCDVVIWTIS